MKDNKERMQVAVLTAVLILPVVLSRGAPGDVDPTFDTGSAVVGQVQSVAAQSDGKVIIGGYFRANGIPVTQYGLARLNPNGTFDDTFHPAIGDSDIRAIALQPDGKILIGGYFTLANGTNQSYLARLNVDGSVDRTFDPGTGPDNWVVAIVVQPDSKILAGGTFTSVNGASRNGLARLNADGTLDGNFDPRFGSDSFVGAMALGTDGKIVVGGYFSAIGGTSVNSVLRLNADGSLDAMFSPAASPDGDVLSVAVQTDGKVVVGGGFVTINGTNRSYLARLNVNGSVDGTFNPIIGRNGTVESVVVQTDGKVMVGGYFTNINATSRNAVGRLNADGSLDSTFGPGVGAVFSIDPVFGTVAGDVSSLVLQADGKVLVGGNFRRFNGTLRNGGLARLNANGSVDATFAPDGGASGAAWSIARQADGKVVVGGDFRFIGATSRNAIGRLKADGSLDSGFNPGTGANGTVYSLVVQTDGKVVVGGAFTTMNGTNRNAIARLNTDGSLDSTFNPGTGVNSDIYSMVVQPDGKVLVGGLFTRINGTNRNHIARLHADGSLDSTFDPGMGPNSWLFAVALQTDGKVLIGGDFIGVGLKVRDHIARLNADGSLDETFTPPFNGSGIREIYSIAVQSDGKVLIGGEFSAIGETNLNGIARLNADGSLDSTFNPGTGVSGYVNSILVQMDGKVLLGGNFSALNGTSRHGLARLNRDGSLDTTFSRGGGVDLDVLAMDMQPNGGVLISGGFASVDGASRNFVARLLGDPVALSIQKLGEQIVLSWPNPAFALQSAPCVTGAYTNMAGATSPYTNSTISSQRYFRLKAD